MGWLAWRFSASPRSARAGGRGRHHTLAMVAMMIPHPARLAAVSGPRRTPVRVLCLPHPPALADTVCQERCPRTGTPRTQPLGLACLRLEVSRRPRVQVSVKAELGAGAGASGGPAQHQGQQQGDLGHPTWPEERSKASLKSWTLSVTPGPGPQDTKRPGGFGERPLLAGRAQQGQP